MGDEARTLFSRDTRYGNLTYEEIYQRATEGSIAIVPTGCTEQQGPHLPVDFDTWFAERLMHAAADAALKEYRVDALVLPALPFGPTPEHRNYGAGYVDLPEPLRHEVAWAILSSLADQGFGRILVWHGCGGHDSSATQPMHPPDLAKSCGRRPFTLLRGKCMRWPAAPSLSTT